MAEQYQPWTWSVPEASKNVKRTMTRQDANDRVTGQASFTRDIYLPGMLYAKILTAPYTHAKIVSMDTSKAEALVGVRDILKFSDSDIEADRLAFGSPSSQYSILTLPGISDFYNHPMGVAVVADSEEICDQALRLIQIEWEERDFILDMAESLKPDAPKIMSEAQRLNATAKEPNTVLTEDVEIGDVEKGFAEADKVVEYTIRRAVNSPAGVEAMACVAQWKGEFLDLWLHDQKNAQEVFDPRFSDPRFSEGATNPAVTDWAKVTVNFPYQGSWFGGISWLSYSICFVRLAAILAKRADGKPVKLLYDESNFYCSGDEAGTYKCKVGTKKDGTITAYHWHMLGVRNPAMIKTHECTSIPNIRGTQEWAFTNIGHQSCFRHGAASCVPHNVMFDRVSAELGLDPTEVALKNDGCVGHNWDWVTQYQKDNGFPQRWSLKEVIDLGKKAMDWDRKWHTPAVQKLVNGKMHGLGFTSVHEWFWGGNSEFSFFFRSHACLMLRNGKVAIVGMRSDMGIDAESGFRHCVAAELGMNYEDTVIQERHSDNNSYTFAMPAGSVGIVNTTPQLVLAARELKQKILQAAVMPRQALPILPAEPAPFPNMKPEDLDIKDSMVFEKANPDNCKTVYEVANIPWEDFPAAAHPAAPVFVSGLTSDGKPDSTAYVMGRQAHFIEVEVDTETGQVEVTNVVCVNDVGHIFNPAGAMGQQYGGAVMGLGRSATEEKVFCPQTGVALNYDHINYHIGTMNDYPVVQCLLNESHLGYGPYGAYGIGENIGASLSAITSSAIYNATGKWVTDFPITPDKVLETLEAI